MKYLYRRFQREINAHAQLMHPNIVHVLDAGQYQGRPYVVMDYLPGGTLRRLMNGPVDYRKAAQLLAPVARALDFAHRHGMVHRDIKPANILLTATGEPVLTDFGIVRLVGEESRGLTSTGFGMGTPEYMAPEQAVGSEVDGRADIYSMGVILYEMVTGKKPYNARTPVEVAVKQATEQLPRPRKFVPDLPLKVEKIILKALARNPADRYSNMEAFTAALEDIARIGGDASNRKTLATDKRSRAGSINIFWLLAGFAGIVCLGLLGFGIWQLFLQNNPDNLAMNPPTPITEVRTQLVEVQVVITGTPMPTVEPSRPPMINEKRVEEVTGVVKVIQPGGEEILVVKDMLLQSGSKIATGLNSGVRILFGDVAGAGMICLYSETNAVLTLDNRLNLDLLTGAAYIQPAPNRTAEIKLPNHNNTIASVTGSRMVVDVRPKITMGVKIWCLEGKCRFDTSNLTGFGVPEGQSRQFQPKFDQADDPENMAYEEQWQCAQPCNLCLGSVEATSTSVVNLVSPQAPWSTSTPIYKNSLLSATPIPATRVPATATMVQTSVYSPSLTAVPLATVPTKTFTPTVIPLIPTPTKTSSPIVIPPTLASTKTYSPTPVASKTITTAPVPSKTFTMAPVPSKTFTMAPVPSKTFTMAPVPSNTAQPTVAFPPENPPTAVPRTPTRTPTVRPTNPGLP